MLVPAIFALYHSFSASPQSTSPSIHIQVDFDTFPHSADYCCARAHLHSCTVLGIGVRTHTECFISHLETLNLSFTFSYYLYALPITVLDYLYAVLYSIFGRHVICVSDGTELPWDESYCRFSPWTSYFYHLLGFLEYNLVSPQISVHCVRLLSDIDLVCSPTI